ncbi:hypothetical protein Tco_1268892 [Tanacetum coccineum]
MKFNNKDAARFDKKKIMKGEDVEIGAAQVYGMIAGAEEDATGNATGDVADDVSNDAAEFALMGISSQVQAYKSTLQTLEQQKGWYQSNQLALEEKVIPAGRTNFCW